MSTNNNGHSQPNDRSRLNEAASDTGIRSVDCFKCGNSYADGRVLYHLREEEAVDQQEIDEFADLVGIPRLPLVADTLDTSGIQNISRYIDPELVADNAVLNDASAMEAALNEWWLKRAEGEARAVVPKAIAYGSNSLMQLGRKLAQLQNREVPDDEALELGCWINAVQKIERWTDAVMRGERCSDDSIYDLGIYVKMAQRIRDVGSWPGV